MEFISYEDKTIAYVTSSMGYPAYYPVHEVKFEKPLKAVLMDLDGTSVRSEEFWIWIIEMTTASLLGNPDFKLEEADMPFVSGHSVSEHLQYCIDKYCPDKTIEEARNYYFEHTHREMNEILEGRGKEGAFVPSPGIKEFLLALKEKGVKIGLVTSGLYEKAWSEIMSAFDTLKMGEKAEDFYDAPLPPVIPFARARWALSASFLPSPTPGFMPRWRESDWEFPLRTETTLSVSRTAVPASFP